MTAIRFSIGTSSSATALKASNPEPSRAMVYIRTLSTSLRSDQASASSDGNGPVSLADTDKVINRPIMPEIRRLTPWALVVVIG